MRINSVINRSEKIINSRMVLSYVSPYQNTIVFSQDRANISDQEIEQIKIGLLQEGIYSQTQTTGNQVLLRIIAEFPKIKKENPWINLLLFFLTIISTTIAGAYNIWNDPFSGWSEFFSGFTFSFSILAILFAHEMGHYYYSLKNNIYATLPYFLPFYFPGFMFGTFGAFIKMKSPIPNKKALFEVGIAGPIAGFVVSLFFLVYGFSILPDETGVIAYVESMHEWSVNGSGALTLGSSLLFSFIRFIMGGSHLPMWEIYHFPFIFAGWIGLFITAINLLPIGQLDGGHISYAMFGSNAKKVATVAFIALAALNFYSINWLAWTILVFFLVKLTHPPTIDESVNMSSKQRILGWFSYIIFITCFPPSPIFIG